MQKILLIGGITLLVAGLAWPLLTRLSLGRMPGDIVLEKGGMKIFFPITTMIIISVVITIAVWLFRK